MVAVAVAFLFPVYALVTLAFKDPGQIANTPLSPAGPAVGRATSATRGSRRPSARRC